MIPGPVAAANMTGAVGDSGTTMTADSAAPLVVVSKGGSNPVPRIVTTRLKLPVLLKVTA